MIDDVPGWPAGDPVRRDAADAADRVARRVRSLASAWPLKAGGGEGDVWRHLAAAGREDLAVARLLEGHVDALRILAEAGRDPVPGAVYGVWASASGGTGLTLDGDELDGVLRYCSGAWFLDRALVVAAAPDGRRLYDVDVRGAALTRHEDTWPAVGMDVTRSVDVTVRGARLAPGDAVGPPGFYLDRPGFTAGGAGVAAVWLGGAAGVVAAVVAGLQARRRQDGHGPTPHQLAHVGAMTVAVSGADAVLDALAARVDGGTTLTAADALLARSAVEAAAGEVLRRAPRVTGPTPMCRDAAFAHRLADLEVYVRQHHAEADLERLGTHVLDGTLRGGRR